MGSRSDETVVSFRVLPPVAVAGPLILGWLLTFVRGDPVQLGPWHRPVGAAILVVFLVWHVRLLRMFFRNQTGLLPGESTETLLVTGPFRVSRNPIYLGLLFLYLGLALLAPSFWALVLLPVVVALLDWGAIRPEERFLHRRFGAEYDDYARRVRRWL
ncbi:methyltransferase family protein [Oryzobacter telluris]|uniref:methyltransferase family protein n=1 Tax=Oryzobacter telluris TaxID=3149179 RepID=UPI00370D7549